MDDIGFGAIDTFGGLIEAPNISRLAAGGLRYTNFHTTFDIGCDKGAPVTNEHRPLAAFTGVIVQVTMDIDPEAAFDAERHTASRARQTMLRQ